MVAKMKDPPRTQEEAEDYPYRYSVSGYTPMLCAWETKKGWQCGRIISADGGSGPGGIYCKRHGKIANTHYEEKERNEEEP